MLHQQRGEEGPDPGPPPCSTLPTWVLLPAPCIQPSSLLTFPSPEERSMEANPNLSLEMAGPWGGWSRVPVGWQRSLRSMDWQRGFRVPPGCPQLRSRVPHCFHAKPTHPRHTRQCSHARSDAAPCTLQVHTHTHVHTLTCFQSIPRPAWPRPSRAPSLCHPPG